MKYLVSDEHKFIYFVVQKVACTSLKTALLPLFDVEATSYQTAYKSGATRVRIHKLFDAYGYINEEQLVAKLDKEYQGYFKFAFVRNPWDRLASCYFEKIMDAKKTDAGKPALRHQGDTSIVLYKGMPFAEFVEAVHGIPDELANSHFKSQYKVICAPGKDRLIMADFVGRFENLKADFSVVAERIGGDRNLKLPHRMRSKSRESRPYTEFYDARLRNLVYERYQEDIEIFGYSFGHPHSLPPLLGRDSPPISPPRNQDERAGWLDQDAGERFPSERKEVRKQNQRLRKRNRKLEQRLLDKINHLRVRLFPPYK